jgi:hypothetical protein
VEEGCEEVRVVDVNGNLVEDVLEGKLRLL